MRLSYRVAFSPSQSEEKARPISGPVREGPHSLRLANRWGPPCSAKCIPPVILRKCKQSAKVCVCVVLTAVLSLCLVSTGPPGSTPVHPPAGHRTQLPQQQRAQTEPCAGTSAHTYTYTHKLYKHTYTSYNHQM